MIDNPNLISRQRLQTYTRKLNYVVTENGTLVVGKKANIPGGGHIDLAGGKPVQAAGEVKLVNGQIKYIDNSSGHYQPIGEYVRQTTESAFNQSGFSSSGKYVEKVWVPDPKHPRGGMWSPVP